MQFNSHATSQDIVSEINALCDSDATSYPIADKTRRVNIAYETLIGEILNADGTWEWDDTNQTDLPVGTGTLVEGQESYTFAGEYLKIKRIKVKDVNGKWQLLKQLDQEDLRNSGISIEQYFGTDSSGNPVKGMPEYYDILGDSFRLYPAPTSTAVTLAAGVKVEFARTADLFTTTDTTQEPGLPSTHHVLLAYMASLPYCLTYKKDRVQWLNSEIEKMKKSLIKHFTQRNEDKRPVMTMAKVSYM